MTCWFLNVSCLYWLYHRKLKHVMSKQSFCYRLTSYVLNADANKYHRIIEVPYGQLKVDFPNYIKKVMPFYAVARGKNTGVFSSWAECQEQINGFQGAIFKKFLTMEQAEEFVQERSNQLVDRRKKPDSDSSSNFETGEFSLQKSSIFDENGRLSPTLLEMKNEMKNLQKQLSSLRDKFDDYVSSKAGPSEGRLKRKLSAEASSKLLKQLKLNIPAGKSDGKFIINEEGFLVIYTDGACEFNGRNGARAGIGVYFGPFHEMNVSEPVVGRATNNTAEIQAATVALELTKCSGFDKVVIKTDSQFVISCMTSWLKQWKKNNWRKSDGNEVINKEDLKALDKATEGLLIKWSHVKGHDGNPGNEAADKLARDGAKRYVVNRTEDIE